MWFSLFCLLLFIAITYFQLIQGVFSALIMFVVTLLSVGIAFNSYEYVALHWLSSWQPDLALPIAFLGTFAIPLIVMRLMFDALVRRMVMIPIIVDRIAAGIFGLCTGLIITGMLVLGIQMIPFGGSFLGYSRVDLVQDLKFTDEQDVKYILDRTATENSKIIKLADPAREESVWLSPDRIAVAFARMLAGGVFSGENPDFEKVHPDLVQEVGWNQATQFDTLHFAPPDSVKVQESRRIETVYDRTDNLSADAKPTYEPVAPKHGSFLAVKLAISQEARDRDGKRRFQLRQIILVGDDGHGQLRQYHPIAVVDPKQADRHVRIIISPNRYGSVPVKKPAADYLLQVDEGKDAVEVVFDLPEKFTPRYIIYKQGARASFPRKKEGGPEATAPPTRTSGVTEAEPPREEGGTSGGSGAVRQKLGGRVGGARAIAVGTHYGDDFPVPMTSYQGIDEEVSADMLQQGHLVGHIADQGEKSDSKMVSRFKVPGSKRLLQFNVENLRARSGLGKALSSTVKVLQNFQLMDVQGHVYTPVGRYALANVDGDELVEVMYFPEYAESGARALKNFSRIQDRHLQGDSYKLVYLFLIDPGSEIVRFQTGSASSPAEDLKGLVPKAPD
ncbi:MAG TPA: CvpA family protein [Phycisphaerae bacterium]|jgi:hypothetical protein